MEISAEIRKRYLDRRKKELELCKKLLIHKDYQQLEVVGHKMYGNGSTFGIPEISSIGRKLEKSAQLEDEDEIQKNIDSISEIINSLH